MGSIQSRRFRRAAAGPSDKCFSVADADRALPLVSRILSDIVAKYRELQQCRRERAALRRQGRRSEADLVDARGRQAAGRLEEFTAELAELGVQLENLEVGLVDFPGRRDGQRVSLCWKLGEPRVRFWHVPNAGFADRLPIDEACQ